MGTEGEEIADSPDAIPVFATAARSAILAPMPKMDDNATQPWLTALVGNDGEITRCVAVMNLALCGIKADFVPGHADTFLESFSHRVSDFYQLEIVCGSNWSCTMRNSLERVSVL